MVFCYDVFMRGLSNCFFIYAEALLIGCLVSERGKMASRALADGEAPILERLEDRFLFPVLSGAVYVGSSLGIFFL